jgi:hypothetical protein
LAVVELSHLDAIPPSIGHFENPDIHDWKTEFQNMLDLKVAGEFDHHQQNDHHVHVLVWGLVAALVGASAPC